MGVRDRFNPHIQGDVIGEAGGEPDLRVCPLLPTLSVANFNPSQSIVDASVAKLASWIYIDDIGSEKNLESQLLTISVAIQSKYRKRETNDFELY